MKGGGKAKIRKAYNFKPCIYCAREMVHPNSEAAIDNPGLAASIEHIITRSRNGPNAYWNLDIACQRCNNLRGDLLFELFEPFGRVVIRRYPNCPTPILKDVLRQYIVSLAEIAVRNNVESKKALLVCLLGIGEQLKFRNINAS